MNEAFSDSTRRRAVEALARLRVLLDVTRSLQSTLNSPFLTDPDAVVLAEVLALLDGVENASLGLVEATEVAWASAIDDLRSVSTSTEDNADASLDSDELALIEQTVGAIAAGIKAVEELHRAFGHSMFKEVSRRGLLTPRQFADLGALLKNVVTDQFPLYGTISQALKMLRVADVEAAWDALAAPARPHLVLAALQRGLLQMDVAKNYFFLMWGTIMSEERIADGGGGA